MVAVGQPITVNVTVNGGDEDAGYPAPSGTVTVSDGTRTCEASLSGSAGIAKASCTITEEAPGNYSLNASYSGDSTFVSSSTSTPTVVAVSKATSATALMLSSTKLTYGHEQVELLSVTAAPQYAGSSPTGTATIKEGTTTLCVATLANGKGSCSPTATELSAGTYKLSAIYGGSPSFTASTSTTTTVTVAKATTKTALKLSYTTVTYGHEQAERLSVTVSPQFAGVTPTGTVTVKAFATTLCAITLSSGKGACRLLRKKLKAGTRFAKAYNLVARYSGSADFTSSASAKKTLIVAK